MNQSLSGHLWVKQRISKVLRLNKSHLQAWVMFIPLKARRALLNALVVPIADYGSIIHLELSASNKCELQWIQNSCMRFIYGLRRRDWIPTYIHHLLFSMTTHQVNIPLSGSSPVESIANRHFSGGQGWERLGGGVWKEIAVALFGVGVWLWDLGVCAVKLDLGGSDWWCCGAAELLVWLVVRACFFVFLASPAPPISLSMLEFHNLFSAS